MSSLASVEFAQSPEDIAGLIDSSLAEIAKNVPREVMTSRLGVRVVHHLHQVDGVGVLEAMYTGTLKGQDKLGQVFNWSSPDDAYVGIQIIARDPEGAHGIAKTFALDYWRNAQVITPTAAEHVVYAQQDFPELGSVVQTLHHAYLGQLTAGAEVIDLAEHIRNRTEDLAQ
jgi:hypothetical protein